MAQGGSRLERCMGSHQLKRMPEDRWLIAGAFMVRLPQKGEPMKKLFLTLAFLLSLVLVIHPAYAQSFPETKARAAKGDAAAQAALGLRYAKGEGVKQDWARRNTGMKKPRPKATPRR